MTSEPLLETGTDADVEACVALWLVALEARDGHAAVEGSAERARAKFAAPIVAFAVLGDETRCILGFVLVTVPGTGNPGDPLDAAYLSMIAVDPTVQGRGFASHLVEEAVTRSRAAGHPRCVLHVLSANTAAVHLYESRGWRPLGEPFAYPLTGEATQTFVVGPA